MGRIANSSLIENKADVLIFSDVDDFISYAINKSIGEMFLAFTNSADAASTLTKGDTTATGKIVCGKSSNSSSGVVDYLYWDGSGNALYLGRWQNNTISSCRKFEGTLL